MMGVRPMLGPRISPIHKRLIDKGRGRKRQRGRDRDRRRRGQHSGLARSLSPPRAGPGRDFGGGASAPLLLPVMSSKLNAILIALVW